MALVDRLAKTLPDRPRPDLPHRPVPRGRGAIEFLANNPRTFAGALLAAARAENDDVSEVAKFARVPIWFTHAADDPVVPYQGSVDLANALEAAGTPRHPRRVGGQQLGRPGAGPRRRDGGAPAARAGPARRLAVHDLHAGHRRRQPPLLVGADVRDGRDARLAVRAGLSGASAITPSRDDCDAGSSRASGAGRSTWRSPRSRGRPPACSSASSRSTPRRRSSAGRRSRAAALLAYVAVVERGRVRAGVPVGRARGRRRGAVRRGRLGELHRRAQPRERGARPVHPGRLARAGRAARPGDARRADHAAHRPRDGAGAGGRHGDARRAGRGQPGGRRPRVRSRRSRSR